jgi:hypothetical protein
MASVSLSAFISFFFQQITEAVCFAQTLSMVELKFFRL